MTSPPLQTPAPVRLERAADPQALPVLTPAQVESFWEATDCAPGTIRLVTVQARSALEILAAGGRLTGSVEHVIDENVAAYSWMSVQLERLGWEVVGAPVWAWARVDFEALVSLWPDGALDDVVVLVVEVPLDRALLSAFDPWQELLDEQVAGTPNPRWARCLDVADFPDSAIQAVLPYVEAGDVVRVSRLTRRCADAG